MAKIKADVSQVEDVSFDSPRPGMYRCKIVECEDPRPSQNNPDNTVLPVVFEVVDGDFKGAKLWYYPVIDGDNKFTQARWKEFVVAVTGKTKATIDTEKLVGIELNVKVKAGKNQEDEYRGEVAKVLTLADDDDEEEDDEDGEEPDAAEPDDDEEGDEDDEDDEDEVDLDDLDRAALKAFIVENDLKEQVGTIKKSMSDDDIRKLIVEALGEEDDDDGPDDGYDDLDVEGLKKILKERGLATGGNKAAKVARLRMDDEDEEEPF